MQWFHPLHHRIYVEKVVVGDTDVDCAVRYKWVESLSRRPGKFADWRWQTFRRALRSSRPLRGMAFHLAMLKNNIMPDNIKATVLSDEYWGLHDMLFATACPLLGFESLCQGCPCH